MAVVLRLALAACLAIAARGHKGAWEKIEGINCYSGRGGNLITGENPIRRGLNLEQCMDACVDEPSCEACEMQDNDDHCFLRRDIVPEQCAVATGYNLYIRKDRPTMAERAQVAPGLPAATAKAVMRGWRPHKGKNCYPGHGAEIIEGMAPVPMPVTSVSHCQEIALTTPSCTAITMRIKNGDTRCFLLTHVGEMAEGCDDDSEYTTWTLTESQEQYQTRVAGQVWEHHRGMNCKPGMGGEEFAGMAPYPKKLTLDVCKWTCLQHRSCNGVVMAHNAHRGVKGFCWMKREVTVEKCVEDSSYDFWLAPHFHNFPVKVEELANGEEAVGPSQTEGRGFHTAAHVAAFAVPVLFGSVALAFLFRRSWGFQEGAETSGFTSGSGSDSEDLELRKLLEG